MGRGRSRSLQDPRPLRWGRSPSPHGPRGAVRDRGQGGRARGKGRVWGASLCGPGDCGSSLPCSPLSHRPGGRQQQGAGGPWGRGRGEAAGAVCEVRPGHSEPWTALDGPSPPSGSQTCGGAGGSPETPPEGVEEGPSHRPGTPGTCPRASAPAPEVRPGPPRAACLTAGKRSRPPPGLNLPAFHYQVAAGARSPTPARGSGLQRRD